LRQGWVQKKAQTSELQPGLQSLTTLFPAELYSYTEESEFNFNREAFEITAYSQGSNGKIIVNSVDVCFRAIFT